jgi:hypothetical protein
MTSYTAITNGEIDQDSPITQPLMTAMRDNPLSMFETDSSAPLAAFAWQIEDGAGGTDPIYDHSVDGTVTSITTPDFADGWEYMLVGVDISMGSSGASSVNLDFHDSTTGSSHDVGDFTGAVGTGDTCDFEIVIPMPRWSRGAHFASAISCVNHASFTSYALGRAAADFKVDRVTIDPVGTGADIDAGKVWLLKRAVYAGR